MKSRSSKKTKQNQSSEKKSTESKEPSNIKRGKLLYINPTSKIERKAQLDAVPFYENVSVAPDCNIDVFEAAAEKLSENCWLIIYPGTTKDPGTSIEKTLSTFPKLGEQRCLLLAGDFTPQGLVRIAEEFPGYRTLACSPETPLLDIIGILPLLKPWVKFYLQSRVKNDIQRNKDEILLIVRTMRADTLLQCHHDLADWEQEIMEAYNNRPAVKAKQVIVSPTISVFTSVSTSSGSSVARSQIQDTSSIQNKSSVNLIDDFITRTREISSIFTETSAGKKRARELQENHGTKSNDATTSKNEIFKRPKDANNTTKGFSPISTDSNESTRLSFYAPQSSHSFFLHQHSALVTSDDGYMPHLGYNEKYMETSLSRQEDPGRYREEERYVHDTALLGHVEPLAKTFSMLDDELDSIGISMSR